MIGQVREPARLVGERDQLLERFLAKRVAHASPPGSPQGAGGRAVVYCATLFAQAATAR